MIHEVDQDAQITIAASQNQLASIRAQIGDMVGISIEPCRRDTFPAIALATAYLHDVQGVSEDETVIVCPVDPYVELPYYQTLKKLSKYASWQDTNLVLVGIEPTYPSEKYGYILPATSEHISIVEVFKEKPDAGTARHYISQGALWNAGVFAFKLDYVLNIAKNIFGTSSHKELLKNYSALTKISFDYAVVEKEVKTKVVRFSGEWKDLGTWNTLTAVMSDEITGNAVAVDCENTHIINELQIPLVVIGAKNLAVVSTADGVLVTEKSKSSKLKDYVPNQRPMCEKKSWGEYNVLDYRIQSDGMSSLTKHLIINPNQHISYQEHAHRSKIWTIIEGDGILVLNGEVSVVARGDIAYIKPGMKHGIKAKTELHIIEVQIGQELIEADIERYDWSWY